MILYLPLVLSILIFSFFIWFAVVSFIEKELLAGKRSLNLAFLLSFPFALIHFIDFNYKSELSLVIGIGLIIVLLILFLPIKKKGHNYSENPQHKYDERNTMFSRKEIGKKPGKLKAYYETNPENKKIDDEWRKKPGLMSEKSNQYQKITYTAADASFFAIESLRDKVDGSVNDVKANFQPNEMSQFIKTWSNKLGSIDTGICELKDYHLYSHRGRGEFYDKAVVNKHKFAIALTVEMDKDLLATGPAGPTLMESANQYLNSGVIAIQIAKFIRELGFEARAHIDGNYEIICPLVARDAGMGEIGRMGLLMTPKLGPRVRIAVVTTNLPLTIDNRKPDYTVHDFCTLCKKCADVCPSQAIESTDMKVIDGAKRWQINQEKCFSYWCTSGTDCGRCMSVCPYSHPNNLLHNVVRWGIKNNRFFQRVALHMDDFFYGRKPKPAKIPQWLNLSEVKEN